MAEKMKIKKGDSVCFWLAYGQPYLATVAEVYADQLGAGGGPTVDLTFNGDQDRQSAQHVQYNPTMQPYTYCLPDDRGWPGTLPKPGAAPVEAVAEPAAPAAKLADPAGVKVTARATKEA